MLQKLAELLNEDGLSYRNLRLFRQFYLLYPQVRNYLPTFFLANATIWQSLTAKLLLPDIQDVEIWHSVSAKSQTALSPIGQSLTAQSDKSELPQVSAENIVHHLSFTHIKQLLPIEDPLKRVFYEVECIKGTWSVRELKRQIDTLFYERCGMSRKPELLTRIVQEKAEPDNISDFIKSPAVFEFIGLNAKDVVYESDLEQALMDNIQQLLLELGNGFCFEARQKKILIEDEYFFIDLVFYHRLLHCHVLIDIKTDAFKYEHIGQLNTYLEYYKHNVMGAHDNPPVGILFVTNKNTTLVEYAKGSMDNQLFVSKYLLELPDKNALKALIEKESRR